MAWRKEPEPLLVFSAICTCSREARRCRDAKRTRGNAAYQFAKFRKWFIRQPGEVTAAVRTHIHRHIDELLPNRERKRALWPVDYEEIYDAMLRLPEPEE